MAGAVKDGSSAENEWASITHEFSINSHRGRLTICVDKNDNPRGIAIKMDREGPAVAGLVESFSGAVTIMLEQGLPLAELCKTFIGTKFEPAGFTGNPEIPCTDSVVDYVFTWLKFRFLPDNPHLQPTLPGV